MSKSSLSPELLAAALQGLEAQCARLDTHVDQVRRMLGARTRPPKPSAPPAVMKPKRRISAAGHRRIAEAARKQ